MALIVPALSANGNPLVAVAGLPFTLVTTLRLNGAVYDVTGDTITANLRRENDPYHVIDATCEDIAVTLTTPASGIVTLTITAPISALLRPYPGRYIDELASILARFTNVTDGIPFPEVLQFHVQRA